VGDSVVQSLYWQSKDIGLTCGVSLAVTMTDVLASTIAHALSY
jgi:hypothetical protein